MLGEPMARPFPSGLLFADVSSLYQHSTLCCNITPHMLPPLRRQRKKPEFYGLVDSFHDSFFGAFINSSMVA
jgi:hypothetical protein